MEHQYLARVVEPMTDGPRQVLRKETTFDAPFSRYVCHVFHKAFPLSMDTDASSSKVFNLV